MPVDTAAFFDRFGEPPVTHKYGTAGFRANADSLARVMSVVGTIAALRSRSLDGHCIGVMVTASHNPVQDNGVKIIDASGGMLSQAWEPAATELVNAATPAEFDEALKFFANAVGDKTKCKVLIARDTRPTSQDFAQRVSAGASMLNAEVIDIGIATTPQAHWAVARCNMGQAYDQASYANFFARSIKDFLGDALASKLSPLYVDSANGVGAQSAVSLGEALKSVGVEWNVTHMNTGDGPLNDGVGAEHVQKQLQPPANMGVGDLPDKARCASLDGDADRLVFFDFREGGMRLFDGDRIAVLLAVYVAKQLQDSFPELKFRLVQTAYANGGSTDYVRDVLKVGVDIAKTGVKFVHHKAEESDIGIYFEANGHGTALFSSKAVQTLESSDLPGAKKVLVLRDVINEYTGDALSDALAVECVLAELGMSFDDWYALYPELPSRQLKTAVPDRGAVKTNEDETRVLEPSQLQADIDALVSKYTRGRAFARPSGTEDVVRVYAEAASRTEADELANAVVDAIKKNLC